MASRPRSIRFALIACLVAFATAFTSMVVVASNASAMTTTEQYYANAMLKLLNSERALYHLAPLTSNSRLISSARSHDWAMERYNLMSHQVPGEAPFGTRVTRTGYIWSRIGENIGWNSSISTSGILALERYMFNETAPNNLHRLNILNRYYKNIGLDVFIDNVHHKVWFTQDFGTWA
jgi:uncharacterized protein YkwD